MFSNPVFSIIIPVYNRAKMLQRSVESILNQTYADWEIVIIDDGSTDSTAEVAKGFTDSRIKYFYQENQEKCIARNNGIHLSSGSYICFLDSDDFWLPNHFEQINQKLEKENFPVAMLVSGLYIEENGERYKHHLFEPAKESALRFAWKHFMVPSSVCLHKQIVCEFKFSEKFYIWEDRHLWLRILTKFPLIQLPEYTCVLFEHPERSIKVFYKKISMKKTKMYFNSIEDLFQSHGELLSKEITITDKRKFIARRCHSYLQIAVKNAQFRASLFLFDMLLKNRPSFAFSISFLKLAVLLPLNKIRFIISPGV